MAAPVASRAFRHTVAENVSTVMASQADMGCFDSTAACAALQLSMTGVEKIKKSQALREVRRQPNAVEVEASEPAAEIPSEVEGAGTPRSRHRPQFSVEFSTTTAGREPAASELAVL